VNLILAAIWLVFAVGLFVMSALRPEAPFARIGQTGIPTGLVALCLCLYNLVRWWTSRQAAERRRALSQPLGQRRYDRGRDPDHDRQPDPNFDFSERPIPPRPPGAEPRP
jgi:hypothetical protein